jgi:hypothetical protein
MHLNGYSATTIAHLNTEATQWFYHHRHGAVTECTLTLDEHRLVAKGCYGREEACCKSRLTDI